MVGGVGFLGMALRDGMGWRRGTEAALQVVRRSTIGGCVHTNQRLHS